MVEKAQHSPINEMSKDARNWCLGSVVASQESGRLKLAGGIGAMLFACHSRMNGRKNQHANDQDKKHMDKADRCSKPYVLPTRAMKCRDVDQSKNPTIQEMDDKPNPPRSIPISCEQGP